MKKGYERCYINVNSLFDMFGILREIAQICSVLQKTFKD